MRFRLLASDGNTGRPCARPRRTSQRTNRAIRSMTRQSRSRSSSIPNWRASLNRPSAILSVSNFHEPHVVNIVVPAFAGTT